jgi:hypothetical protein
MTRSVPIAELAEEIRSIYRADPSRAGALIERHLHERLRHAGPVVRKEALTELTHAFAGEDPRTSASAASTASPDLHPEVLSRLFSLFLGERVGALDLSSGEIVDRLARSLNTVFENLNEIVAVIQSTLLGKRSELATIRHLIGTNLQDEGGGTSLEGYLGQIREAFLTAHLAFQQAARATVGKILRELDPERLEDAESKGLKFGPLRKAGLFEAYEEKFRKIRQWFDSGRVTEELLREFEKICQSRYGGKGGSP